MLASRAGVLDHAVVADRRIEVHDCAPDAIDPLPTSAADLIEAVAACLQHRGLTVGKDRGGSIDRAAPHVRMLAGPRLGLLVEDAPPDRDHAATKRAARRRGSRSAARTIALALAPRAALGAVESALEAGVRGPMPVRITAVPGAGLSTFLGSVARVARRHGVVPVCPQALARPDVLSRLRDQTLVLIVDEPPVPRVPISTALALAVRRSIGVAAVVGRKVGAPDDLGFDLPGLPLDVLTRSVSIAPPIEAATLAVVGQSQRGHPRTARPGLAGNRCRAAVCRIGWTRSRPSLRAEPPTPVFSGRAHQLRHRRARERGLPFTSVPGRRAE